jgi:hypothetical protein
LPALPSAESVARQRLHENESETGYGGRRSQRLPTRQPTSLRGTGALDLRLPVAILDRLVRSRDDRRIER